MQSVNRLDSAATTNGRRQLRITISSAYYQEYVRSVVDHPLMVGCHYFKYADEPLTGRPGDGENYNIGVASVIDTPYPEFIEAARTVHAEAYDRRAGSNAR
jgi:hypothetical protein